jgi:hypothetical protein
MRCPCCNGSGVIPDGPPVYLSKLEAKVWDVIRRHPGISSDDLADRVYSDRDDGGPLYARSNVIKTVGLLNKRLIKAGFRVENRNTTKTHGGYRLCSLPDEDASHPLPRS